MSFCCLDLYDRRGQIHSTSDAAQRTERISRNRRLGSQAGRHLNFGLAVRDLVLAITAILYQRLDRWLY